MRMLGASPTVRDSRTPSISRPRGITSVGRTTKRMVRQKEERKFDRRLGCEPSGSKHIDRHHEKAGRNDSETRKGDFATAILPFAKMNDSSTKK